MDSKEEEFKEIVPKEENGDLCHDTYENDVDEQSSSHSKNAIRDTTAAEVSTGDTGSAGNPGEDITAEEVEGTEASASKCAQTDEVLDAASKMENGEIHSEKGNNMESEISTRDTTAAEASATDNCDDGVVKEVEGTETSASEQVDEVPNAASRMESGETGGSPDVDQMQEDNNGPAPSELRIIRNSADRQQDRPIGVVETFQISSDNTIDNFDTSLVMAVAELVDENYEQEEVQRRIDDIRHETEQEISQQEAELRMRTRKLRNRAYAISLIFLLLFLIIVITLLIIRNDLFGRNTSNIEDGTPTAPSTQYTPAPSFLESRHPTGKPTAEPASQPTAQPTAQLTYQPTAKPTKSPEPTYQPTAQPTYQPTYQPTAKPTESPEPTYQPTAQPTKSPLTSAELVKYSRTLECASKLSYSTYIITPSSNSTGKVPQISSEREMLNYIDQNENSPQHRAVSWHTHGYAAQFIEAPYISECEFGKSEFAERYALLVVGAALNMRHWFKDLDEYGRPSYMHLCSEKEISCIDGAKAQDLILKNSAVSGVIPHEIGGLKNLETFDVSNNPDFTGTIGDEISNLITLKILNFQNTAITGSLPKSWQYLSNLHTLDLSFTSVFGSVPVEWAQMGSLENLNLRNTDLTGSVPKKVCNLSVRLNVEADCLYFNGLPPEIVCDCCKRCCASNGEKKGVCELQYFPTGLN